MNNQDQEPIQLSDQDRAPIGDDDLLANAIPIDDLDESEVSQPQIEEGDVPKMDLVDSGPNSTSKIKALGSRSRHADKWTRMPNVTGHGAIHVKTFVAKLRPDAIEYLDHQINEWLDSNPEYEVKFVTTNVGELMAKMKEPALFVNVWV
jgi:hypothetical protein